MRLHSPLQASSSSLALMVLMSQAVLAAPAPAVDCTTGSFEAILAGVPEATVGYAGAVAEGGSFGIPSLAFPTNATEVPAVCAVSINVKSEEEGSSYNFGLFLPDATWNERFLTTGNGGYGGGINWPDMGRMAHYGFATMSTDTGHNSSSDDVSWGLNAPETIVDWGHRAMHGSVALSKSIIGAYYGVAGAEDGGIKFSYYASCSTGGRQGLREIQLHPESFDGIAVGAPAWWTPHLAAGSLKMPLDNLPEDGPGHIPDSLFAAIEAEMIKQCDPQDGVTDEIVSDPFGCNFDFGALLCTTNNHSSSGTNGNNSSAPTCLTAEQLQTVRAVYSDWVVENADADASNQTETETKTETLVFPGLALGASPAFMMSPPSGYGFGLFANFVYNDTDWDYTALSYADVRAADAVNPGSATAGDFAALLGPYADRGGKVLMYHGGADPLIPTGSSLAFYRALLRQAGTATGKETDLLDEFYRFFLVPGMSHCAGSATAPWYVGGGSQAPAGTTHSVPGYEDADHDIVLAMVRWVEEGAGPDRLVATKFADDDAAGGVQSQRPLCVYPRQARYVGSGDVNRPENWECK